MGYTEKVTYKLEDKQELILLIGQESFRYKGLACGILKEDGRSSVPLELDIHWVWKENARTICIQLSQPLKCLLYCSLIRYMQYQFISIYICTMNRHVLIRIAYSRNFIDGYKE